MINVIAMISSFLGPTGKKVIGVLIFIGALGATYQYHINTVDALSKRISHLETTNTLLAERNARYMTTIDNQSNAIAELEQESTRLREQLDDMDTRRQVLVAEYDREIEELRNKKAPTDTREAFTWMLDRAKEDLQWKK